MIRLGFFVALVALIAADMPAAASIRPVRATGSNDAPPHSTNIATGPATSVPYGWVDFCRRYAGECAPTAHHRGDIALTDALWKTVNAVNRQVNGSVQPVSDMEHWGVVDQWDYPTDGRGDCEDYALMKRKLLIESGLPAASLLMTVVRDLRDEGHAVLMVKTEAGDYVLDNMNDLVRPWQATGYRFVKRQSQEDANLWVRLRGSETPVVGSAR